MTNYPRDEFDRVPENSARHGVHRASLEASSRSLMPIVIFGVAALCIGLLAFLIVPKINGQDTSTKPVAGQTNSAPASSGQAKASQTGSAASATTAPSATPSAVPTTAPVVTPTPGPGVDKTTPVAIFNATGIGGLAAKYSAAATADGWTVSQTGNWAGAPQAVSSIIYSGTAQEANAEALGKLLNIPTLLDSAELGVPLAIVLGPGAQ